MKTLELLNEQSIHTDTAIEQQPLQFYLRKFKNIQRYKCYPLYNEQLSKELVEWGTKKSGIKKGTKAYHHTISSGISYWIALCFPLTKDLNKFKKTFYFFQMFTTMDDHADEDWGDAKADSETIVKFWKKAIKLVETLRDSAPWSIKVLRTILMRMPNIPIYMRRNFSTMKSIIDDLSPMQRERYINSFKSYMENAMLQAQMSGKEKSTTLEQYKEYRVKSIASIPCTLMLEYLYNIELTNEEYFHPKLQELEKIGTLHIAFINDLFSLFKEYKGTFENLHLAVSIFILNEGMTLQQAIDKLCDEIEQMQEDYIQLKEEWFSSGEYISDNVRRFIEGQEYYMAGNEKWHRLSKRYHGESFNTTITSGIMKRSSEGGTIYIPDDYKK
ncbi:hypothetical protein DRF60_20105 [Chryseobacterium elymi]|uniref:Terpene synthase n=1 Tax=Chryseobacterium elymi TaxID=395936 RepID=A0A3D9D3K6_9FLAO|nr:terpene synthase family protein [Chryseobacterium elymi]REC72592.1 hypothetical protein DRF60_20105 [Chryseobacterium elymi]